jgi:2-polyprenyl-3-methyl-5-hydroxy-6-metoxy-1,4-benzoquinol methylase
MNPNIDLNKLCTPAEFLKAELEMGISMQNEQFLNLCKHTAEQISELEIKTILDYGAGTGVYAESYRRLGYDVFAYEIWDEHKNYIRENAPLVKIIARPITTDLMNFIEVAEHMTDNEIKKLFHQIYPKYILFSSTSEKTEWDESWGHINVKPQDEWIKFFDSIGYEYIKPMAYPTTYTKLFKRK